VIRRSTAAAEVDQGRRAPGRRDRRRHRHPALQERRPAPHRGALRLPGSTRAAVHAMQVRLGGRVLTRRSRRSSARASATRRPSARARPARCSSRSAPTSSR
jgi:hypothetical protein